MTHSPSTPPALLAAIVLFAAITPAVLMTAPALAAQLASTTCPYPYRPSFHLRSPVFTSKQTRIPSSSP